MGATNFSTVAFGKTAADAFRNAVNEARHWAGNEGYTGTIAEKDDFIFIGTPKGVRYESMLKWAGLACSAIYAEDEAEADWNDKATRKAAAKRAKATWAKIPPKHRGLARDMAEISDGDKWGPCLCLEITGKAAADLRKRCGYKGKQGSFYYFAGLASM
jgi:hypothetical protein